MRHRHVLVDHARHGRRCIHPTEHASYFLDRLRAESVVLNSVSDSNPDAQDVLAENLARAVALKLDLGMLQGSGTAPEIRGLKNQSGIQTVSMGTNGAALTNLDPFADALGLLAEANADGNVIVR